MVVWMVGRKVVVKVDQTASIPVVGKAARLVGTKAGCWGG
jgi:hypothetical protein